MGKLGISVYPERSTFEKDQAYLDLAHKYGFKRVFTSLLQIDFNYISNKLYFFNRRQIYDSTIAYYF